MQSVQLAASEIWVTLIFCGILYLFKDGLNQKKVTKVLLIACIARLLSDAVSWAFDGVPGLFWGIITRISNYVTFVSNDAVSLVFSVFIWQLVREKDEKPDVLLKAYWILEAAAIAALTLNLHFGWFYTFDSSNGYSRGAFYHMTHVAPTAALIAVLWLLIKYHRKFTGNQKFLVWSYLILMTGATVYENLDFGLSLQTYAQTFSALIAFFVGEIEVRKDLFLTKERLAQKNVELQEAERRAEAANDAKSTFLFNMSHDIRTPMSAILGFTTLAERNPDDPQLVRSYLQKIQASGRGMLAILDNVLELSRIESGKTVLEETPQEITAVFDACVVMMSPEVEKKHHTLTVEKEILHPYGFFDATRMTEIIMNILSNAIKYTADGGTIRCTLKQTHHPKDGWICQEFTVADNGIGMSEEFQKHIFDSFARERSTTISGIQGTGLGMGIVKKLVDLMGGTINVDSKVGQGTTITVTIPTRMATLEETQPKRATVRAERENLRGKRLLLAEDNDLNAEIAVALLEEEGLLIDRVCDGVACVERLEECQPGYYSLILMDVQMPNLDGYQATEQIRKLQDNKKAHIPIVAMTANAFSEDRARALSAGMNDHVAKPIDMDVLTDVLLKYV